MYKIERRKEIVEPFELGDKSLRVKIIPMELYQRFTKAQTVLILEHKRNQQRKAENRLPSEDEQTSLGLAVIEFVAATMGDDNAKQIIEYFEGDYEEMINQVFPFINDILVPRIMAEVKKIRSHKTGGYTGKRRPPWKRK